MSWKIWMILLVFATVAAFGIGFVAGVGAGYDKGFKHGTIDAEEQLAVARDIAKTNESIFNTAMEVRDHTMALEVRPTDMETAGHIFKSLATTKVYQDPSAKYEIDIIFEGAQFVSHGIAEFEGEQWAKVTPVAHRKDEWNHTGWARCSEMHIAETPQ